MALIECPDCKNKIERETGKCTYCGAEITICPKCDSVEAGDVEFCRSCGEDLEKYRKKNKKRAPIRVYEDRPADECDLVRCLRHIEDNSAFYRVAKVLRSVLLIFFWLNFVSVCALLLVGAFMVMAVYVTSFSFDIESYESVLMAILLFVNVIAVGSILPILMSFGYQAGVNIPFDFIETLISGICAHRYEFGKNATVSVFRNPSLARGIDDAYERAQTIYPFLIGKSKGKIAGIVLDVLNYAYKLVVPVMLMCVYAVYVIALVISIFMMQVIVPVSALLFSLLAGVLALIVFFVMVFVIRSILDIIGNAVREYFANKWADALRQNS